MWRIFLIVSKDAPQPNSEDGIASLKSINMKQQVRDLIVITASCSIPFLTDQRTGRSV